MFPYFGGKKRLCKEYPKPKYNMIIEPFGGSAGYSIFHEYKNVILCEKFEPIRELWKYLINKCTPERIMQFKTYRPGDNVRKEDPNGKPYNEHELLLLYMHAFRFNGGQKKLKYPFSFTNTMFVEKTKKRLAKKLSIIKEWRVLDDFKNAPDIKATWFIDPPYHKAGELYKENKVNFKFLGQWCKKRKGQVIVCEQLGAKWLPFDKLKSYKALTVRGQTKRKVEVVWKKG